MKAGLTFFGVGAACFMTFKNKWWTLPIVFPAALYMKYNTFFVPAMKAVPDLVENATSRSYIGNVYCPHLDVLDPLFAEEFREERKKMLDPTYEQVYQELRNACKAYTNKAAGAPEIFTQFPMAPPSARTPEFFSGRNRGEDQGGLAVIKQGDQPPVERPRRQWLDRAGASRKEEDAMVEEEQSLLSWAGSNSNSNSKTDLMMADRARPLGDSRKVGQWNRNNVEDKETAASVESVAAAPRKMTRQELRDRAHSSDE